MQLPTILTLIALWALFIWMFRRERRRLINAAVLLPTVLLTVSSVCEFVYSAVPGTGFIGALLFILLPLILLVFAFVLVCNGVLMCRREGARLPNLLSLIAGLLVLVLPVLAVLLVMTQHWAGLAAAFILFMGSVYTALIFAMVLLYAWVYARFPAKGQVVAVVVLGARTIKGKATPLLRGRLDKGIALYRSLPENSAYLVPSGGKGNDEVEPEGVSMGRYLSEQGVAKERILVEDQSRNTLENLKFSHDLVRQRTAAGRLWIVTSDYHSLRAGLASRSLGIEAHSFGGKTARYYLPSAFLREFIAIVRDEWKIFGLLAIPFAAVLGLGLVFSLS